MSRSDGKTPESNNKYPFIIKISRIHLYAGYFYDTNKRRKKIADFA